jgi:hypothetical protein
MLGVGALAFVLRVLTLFHPHTDEAIWLKRSENYIDALLSLDLQNATSSVSGGATMPGITTSLVGGVAHLLWEQLQRVGLIEAATVSWPRSRVGLAIAELGVAAVNAVLIATLFWVLMTWSNKVVAATATLLLATEPFVVSHGARLTTDSFLMLFAAVGVFAFLATLGVASEEEIDDRRARRMAVVAGLGLAGGLLSKLPMLTLCPFLLVVVVSAGIRAHAAGTMRAYAQRLMIVFVVGIAAVIVLWPAIWADPGGQLELLTNSAGQIDRPIPRFFFGETRVDPGPLFYVVAVPLRMTPWMLLLTLGATVGAVMSRVTRLRALVVLGYALVPSVVLLIGAKKYDRYSLIIWPAFAVLAGLFIQALLARQRRVSRRQQQTLAVGAVTFVAVCALLVAPNSSVYANPMLGGGEVAQRVIPIGGSINDAGTYIRDREGANCAHRRILSTVPYRLFFPCGILKSTASADQLVPGDYVVVVPQSRSQASLNELESLGRRVERIKKRGVVIVDIYQVPPD